MKLFEVFDTVQVSDELYRVFGETEVLKVSSSKSSGSVTVHIESERLLPRGMIKKLEKELYTQFFRGMEKTVCIGEHYKLSSQYTPASIWEHYYDSLREEFGKRAVYG